MVRISTGEATFSYHAAKLWNPLQVSVKASVAYLKSRLKTELFSDVFP